MNLHEITNKRSIKTERRIFEGMGLGRVEISYDDCCGNGHNSFAITVDARDFGGCMHDEIETVFPEYAHLIKWHLTSTDGPMHYIANTVYHAENDNLEYARSTAIAPDTTIDQLLDKEWLAARLPNLIKEFKSAMESIECGE